MVCEEVYAQQVIMTDTYGLKANRRILGHVKMEYDENLRIIADYKALIADTEKALLAIEERLHEMEEIVRSLEARDNGKIIQEE